MTTSERGSHPARNWIAAARRVLIISTVQPWQKGQMMLRGLSLLVLAAMAVLAGCAHAPSVRFENPMTFADTDAGTLEKVSRCVIQELNFQIEQPQAIEHRIQTDPLTGASWFEFWRPDTVGRFQRWESSLHTIQRRVIITVTPKEKGAEILVRVVKERQSAPNAGPGSIAYTFDIYDLEHSELTRFNEMNPVYFDWVEIGRDDALEQCILERITRRLGSVPQP